MLAHEYDTMRNVEDTYWWYRVLRRMTTAATIRHLPRAYGATILDAGCGTGGTLDALRSTGNGWRLHGFDFSPLAVALCHSRGFADVKTGSVNEVPEADASFDVVISMDVLCCDGVDYRKALLEFHRVLKPGGILIMNLPAFACLRGRHDVAVASVHRFTTGEVRGLHQAAGLVPVSIHYWNAWLFLPILVWRQITRRSAMKQSESEAESDLSPLPAPINGLLTAASTIESSLCRLLKPPFGTSVFSVARKPDSI